jgi:NADH-quinone oxidoreductase subunit K
MKYLDAVMALQPGLIDYLTVASILFCIGLYGAITRRNAIAVLICIELMLNAVNINLVAFSRYLGSPLLQGQIFAIFIITVAAAEMTVGLAIILTITRKLSKINLDEINLMKW